MIEVDHCCRLSGRRVGGASQASGDGVVFFKLMLKSLTMRDQPVPACDSTPAAFASTALSQADAFPLKLRLRWGLFLYTWRRFCH